MIKFILLLFWLILAYLGLIGIINSINDIKKEMKNEGKVFHYSLILYLFLGIIAFMVSFIFLGLFMSEVFTK